jgi:uncharacterized protein (DUF2062 family)
MFGPTCAQLVYTATQVLVAVNTCSGLSTGAIVGIAIGAAVGGIAIAVAIVLFSRYAIQRTTARQKQQLAIKMTNTN